jgi:hypothetical protein
MNKLAPNGPPFFCLMSSDITFTYCQLRMAIHIPPSTHTIQKDGLVKSLQQKSPMPGTDTSFILCFATLSAR